VRTNYGGLFARTKGDVDEEPANADAGCMDVGALAPLAAVSEPVRSLLLT